MKRLSILLIFLLCFSGCATEKRSPSFSSISTSGWSSYEIRGDLDYERAWKAVWNVLCRDFDIEFAARDEGYIRTAWLHTWSGKYEPDYRVRVTAKFSDDRRTISLKSEAQMRQGATWVAGSDARLASTMKGDIMGTIGRTAR